MKHALTTLLFGATLALAACAPKAPAANPAPAPPPSSAPSAASQPAAPPGRAETAPPPPVIPTDPSVTATDPLEVAALEAINRESPLKPVFFAYDSDALDDAARSALEENAKVLRKYPTWVVAVEGHCDERGTPEYNLALGERRAMVAKNYLLSLGIAADRLHPISYGKEFPFDQGHDESAWAKNRRAHFMVTSK